MEYGNVEQLIKKKIDDMYKPGQEYDQFLSHINIAVIDIPFDDQPERLNPEDRCYRCGYTKEIPCRNCLLDKALD